MLAPRERLGSAAMAKLKDKLTNALNETRILILGAQILLGFQFNAPNHQHQSTLRRKA
jgi:hypothetical protein